MLNCVLEKYGKRKSEENRILLIKYFNIFTDLAGGQKAERYEMKILFYQFIETVLNKFDDVKK